jgi:type II secretory pathway pseudopilin PulG
MKRQSQIAFTLIEMAIVLLLITTLVASLALPLAAQVELRRRDETRLRLEEAREALLGFAAATGRLPCPASATSAGLESFAPGGDAGNGHCSHFHDGFLPGAALGLAPLDGEGFVRDPWATRDNRLRYAVFGHAPINGVAHAFTRAGGLRAATLDALGAEPNYLLVCASAQGAAGNSCGPAANHLTRKAGLVVLSAGANASSVPPPGSDEALNLDAHPTFISHEVAMGPGRSFDDLVTWVPVTVLASRMMAAGRLP